MLDEKIDSYKRDIAIAKRLAKNETSDREYYDSMALKLEKMLHFYETLRILTRKTKN